MAPGAPVGQVVAGDAGDHGVAQAHRAPPPRATRSGSSGDERQRVAGVDLAEAAGPGAALAVDHERRRAVGPALVDVRAARLLAHRHQAEVVDGRAELAVALADAHRHAHPRGLALRDVEAVLGRHAGLAQAAQQRALARAAHVRCGACGPRHDVGALGRRPSPNTATARATNASTTSSMDDVDALRRAARSRRGRRCRTARCGRTWRGRSVTLSATPCSGAPAPRTDAHGPHADGGDLARAGPPPRRPTRPGTRRSLGAAGQAEVGQRLDHDAARAGARAPGPPTASSGTVTIG